MDSGTQVEEGTLAMMTRSQKRREQRLPEEKEVAKTQAKTNPEKEEKTESGTKLIGDVQAYRRCSCFKGDTTERVEGRNSDGFEFRYSDGFQFSR